MEITRIYKTREGHVSTIKGTGELTQLDALLILLDQGEEWENEEGKFKETTVMNGAVRFTLSEMAKFYEQMLQADRQLVGTADYVGIAYFWGAEDYKYTLRETTPAERRELHSQLLAAGVPVGIKSHPIIDAFVEQWEKKHRGE